MAADKLYNKGPKIQPEGKGDTVKDGGAPKAAASEAKKTAGDPPSETKKSDVGDSGTQAKGDVMAGTDGIPTYHTQSGERSQMHMRQMMAHTDAYHARERDHLMEATGNHKMALPDIMAKHHADMKNLHSIHEKEMRDMHSTHGMSGDGPSGAMSSKDEGKSGTNKE